MGAISRSKTGVSTTPLTGSPCCVQNCFTAASVAGPKSLSIPTCNSRSPSHSWMSLTFSPRSPRRYGLSKVRSLIIFLLYPLVVLLEAVAPFAVCHCPSEKFGPPPQKNYRKETENDNTYSHSPFIAKGTVEPSRPVSTGHLS